jgi:hypothetical protein
MTAGPCRKPVRSLAVAVMALAAGLLTPGHAPAACGAGLVSLHGTDLSSKSAPRPAAPMRPTPNRRVPFCPLCSHCPHMPPPAPAPAPPSRGADETAALAEHSFSCAPGFTFLDPFCPGRAVKRPAEIFHPPRPG